MRRVSCQEVDDKAFSNSLWRPNLGVSGEESAECPAGFMETNNG